MHRKQVICACVALNWETQKIETFDTHNKSYKDWDLIQFLVASCDAPVYFTTPFLVTGNSNVPFECSEEYPLSIDANVCVAADRQ